MADDIIDLTRYLSDTPHAAPEDEEARGFFSVWGGEGERSRFALPLWRSVYLAAGKRAAIVWADDARPAEAHPLFVLDLGAEPARTEFRDFVLPDPRDLSEAPVVLEEEERVVIYLGTEEGSGWFILLDEREPETDPLEGKTREDLLFLAGECAGLLFYRNLKDDPDG